MDAEKPRLIPKSVWFILFYGLLERYCLFGTTAILAVFLNDQVGLNEYWSTSVYHFFFFFSFGFAVIGAIIADAYWGRFKTLFYGMSLLYVVGSVLLIIGTIFISSNFGIPLITFSLLITSFAWGCFEPNLTAYSGDQYKLPLETKGFSICFGYLLVIQGISRVLGAVVSPIIRDSVKCFEKSDCYPLLFVIFLTANLIALVSLLLGKRHSVMVKPKGNMFVEVCGCVWHAIKIKFTTKSSVNHWLDNSVEKYGSKLVEDVKRLLSLFYLFPSAILMASLFYQTASRWVFQGRLMEGQIGGIKIQAEQIPAIGALTSIIFVFLCESYIVPFLNRLGLKNHLQIITFGGFVSATAFVLAAILQFIVERYSIHVLWQIPQHIVISLGEVLIYVQSTQFFYTQSPVQLRSVMQALFNLILGSGNLIVAVIASIKIFDSMAYEFLLFAGIVYLGMIVYVVYTSKYKYVDPGGEEGESGK